ncbi:hypothetical protein F53441_5364 [Fusarium austroafricanum]|uniref:Uncharacterized protein n=1 Tax=Fusarium austroafricanum TaxID=2364996 RepID=A0A8H4KKB2_9HYPO|nr:hypothetical protein F53441_5364 [Fusarium austroafricanum]
MRLGGLAPELLSLILQNIDSPRGLHDLISASPACLRVFSQSSPLILSSAIRNALPIETSRDFLAVLQTPTPATRSTVSLFLDKYFKNSLSFDFPSNKEDVLSLCQLYKRVTFFIDRYLRYLNELGLGESILILSSSELIRLQRAFLRFEIYSRVFPSDDTYSWETPPPNHKFTAVEQFDLFLSHLGPWEVEEMTCVELYFCILIGGFIDQLEEQLIEAVKKSPGLVWPPSSGSTETEKDIEGSTTQNEDNLWDFKALDLGPLSLFSPDGIYRSPGNISYMTSLGLEFVYSLCTSEERRSELIRSNSPHNREFLPEALAHSPTWPPGHQGEGISIQDPTTDLDLSRGNLGYYLFNKSHEGTSMYGPIDLAGSYYTALRELGYVFWDSRRIQSSDVSERLTAASKMTYSEMGDRFDRRWRKGPEDKLEGAKLPFDEMQRIEKDFGCIRRPTPWDEEE